MKGQHMNKRDRALRYAALTCLPLLWAFAVYVASGGAATADSSTPAPSPSPTAKFGLSLSTGFGLVPGSGVTTYGLNAIPGASPPTNRLQPSDQSAQWTLGIIVLANWPIPSGKNDGQLYKFPIFPFLGKLYGTLGYGSNKTDLVGGISAGDDQGKDFITFGLRDVTFANLQAGNNVGQRLPSGVPLSSVTYNYHVLRPFLGYSVSTSEIGCVLSIFKTDQTSCNKSSNDNNASTPNAISGATDVTVPAGGSVTESLSETGYADRFTLRSSSGDVKVPESVAPTSAGSAVTYTINVSSGTKDKSATITVTDTKGNKLIVNVTIQSAST
jgi:hypothetical protein